MPAARVRQQQCIFALREQNSFVLRLFLVAPRVQAGFLWAVNGHGKPAGGRDRRWTRTTTTTSTTSAMAITGRVAAAVVRQELKARDRGEKAS